MLWRRETSSPCWELDPYFKSCLACYLLTVLDVPSGHLVSLSKWFFTADRIYKRQRNEWEKFSLVWFIDTSATVVPWMRSLFWDVVLLAWVIGAWHFKATEWSESMGHWSPSCGSPWRRRLHQHISQKSYTPCLWGVTFSDASHCRVGWLSHQCHLSWLSLGLYEFCSTLTFLSHLNWQPPVKSRFQLRAQYEGNCLAFRHIGRWATRQCTLRFSGDQMVMEYTYVGYLIGLQESYIILTKFGIRKLVRLINMCLNETCGRFCVCKRLPLRIVWNQGDVLSPFLYNFGLEYASRSVQAN